jgi:hypothetical protein
MYLHRWYPPGASMCATQDEAKAVDLLIDCLALILCHVSVAFMARAKMRHSIPVSSTTHTPVLIHCLDLVLPHVQPSPAPAPLAVAGAEDQSVTSCN